MNVGFPNIFACGKACLSSMESVTFFAISGTSSYMALCCGFSQGSDKSLLTIIFKVCAALVGSDFNFIFFFLVTNWFID